VYNSQLYSAMELSFTPLTEVVQSRRCRTVDSIRRRFTCETTGRVSKGKRAGEVFGGREYRGSGEHRIE
jgi:hypothetical protein